MKSILALSLALGTEADLRAAASPRKRFSVDQRAGSVPFVTTTIPYMEPGIFGYQGLNAQRGQRHNNYDNFLRSNIDNEQDQRNFNTNPGKDHLPFRTDEGSIRTAFQIGRWDNTNDIFKMDVNMTVTPGVKTLVPLRWNNPHASELEVNVWLMNTDPLVVVPVRKPTCSGEGYQDNVIEFTIPDDFVDLGAKVPGFTGCNNPTDCVLQVYAHSVESRTYAFAWPLVVTGHDDTKTTEETKSIRAATKDPWFDLSGLRDLCLYNTAPSADIKSAIPRRARLVSDVFNHAYQDSDFSPYQGQQHESISKNMQAACLQKTLVGNRGELGQTILPSQAANVQANLNNLQKKVYKAYESIANKLIQQLGNGMKSTGTIAEQNLNTCFHCAEVGSTNTNRLTTTTYIPSFQLQPNLIGAAKALVPGAYGNLLNERGQVHIYVAALETLMPAFKNAEQYGIIYQPAKEKTTLSTMADAKQFMKQDEAGNTDGGVYAATLAKETHVEALGCPRACLYCGDTDVRYPLMTASVGTCTNFCDESNKVCSQSRGGTDCTKCDQFYTNGAIVLPEESTIAESVASGGSLPSTGALEVRDMTPAEMHGTGDSLTDGDLPPNANDISSHEDPPVTNSIIVNPTDEEHTPDDSPYWGTGGDPNGGDSTDNPGNTGGNTGNNLGDENVAVTCNAMAASWLIFSAGLMQVVFGF